MRTLPMKGLLQMSLLSAGPDVRRGLEALKTEFERSLLEGMPKETRERRERLLVKINARLATLQAPVPERRRTVMREDVA